jgi:uncharacterized metal-binding protein YceD (DUF177 family)
MSGGPVLSRPVDVGMIGGSGLFEKIAATEAERAALKSELGLVALSDLHAELEVTEDRKGIIRVEGHVVADIVQNCIVSLEPVPQHIDEPVSLRFVPEGSGAAPQPIRAGAEIRVDPDEDDPPETFTGSTIDLGPVMVEHFVLGIDPYPRASGATLPEAGIDAPKGSDDSPFAALAKLRGRPKDD